MFHKVLKLIIDKNNTDNRLLFNVLNSDSEFANLLTNMLCPLGVLHRIPRVHERTTTIQTSYITHHHHCYTFIQFSLCSKEAMKHLQESFLTLAYLVSITNYYLYWSNFACWRRSPDLCLCVTKLSFNCC